MFFGLLIWPWLSSSADNLLQLISFSRTFLSESTNCSYWCPLLQQYLACMQHLSILKPFSHVWFYLLLKTILNGKRGASPFSFITTKQSEVSREEMLGSNPTIPLYSFHPQLVSAKIQSFDTLSNIYSCQPWNSLPLEKHWSKSCGSLEGRFGTKFPWPQRMYWKN